jgi:hypothetical protein
MAPLGHGCTHEKSADDREVEERARGCEWWRNVFRPWHESLQLARQDLRHLRCVRETEDADFALRELAETVRGTSSGSPAPTPLRIRRLRCGAPESWLRDRLEELER